jgi:multiple sugar transport system substrate-binding protein
MLLTEEFSMRKMTVKSLILLACVALVAGLLGTAPARAATEIKMVYWTGPESLAMAQIIDKYNAGQGKTDGVQVQMVLFGREGFWERQETIMAAKSAEVDVFYTASYYVGRAQDALDPITDAVPNIKEAGVFIPSSLESLAIGGNYYGLPLDVSLHFMYYRTDLIEKLMTDQAWKDKYTAIAKDKLGLDLAPKPIDEWSWDDFKAAALFFSKSVNPDSPVEYGTALQAKNLIYNVMIWGNVLYSLGGSWFDANGSPNFDTQEFREAAMIYADLIKMGASPAASTTFEYGEANQAFMSEQAAFMLQWNAAFAELNGPNSPISGKVGIARIPGPKGVSYTHALAVALNKYSNNKEAAGKWLTYLASQEAMETYANAGGLPPVGAVLNSRTDRLDFVKTAEFLEKYSYTPSTGPHVFAILEVLSKNLSAVWAGQKDADSAAKESQAGVLEIVKQ